MQIQTHWVPVDVGLDTDNFHTPGGGVQIMFVKVSHGKPFNTMQLSIQPPAARMPYTPVPPRPQTPVPAAPAPAQSVSMGPQAAPNPGAQRAPVSVPPPARPEMPTSITERPAREGARARVLGVVVLTAVVLAAVAAFFLLGR